MSEGLPTEEAANNAALLLAFSNDKSPENISTMQGVLKMAYHVVLTNKLAVMQAKNTETGQLELILVGVDQSGGGVNCYPLFKPITDTEAAKYASPDGSGGFVGRNLEEVEG